MGFFGQMAKELNLPIANTDFRTKVAPPYAVYFVESENNIYADGIVVYSEKKVSFYLYHKKDDKSAETSVENYLLGKGITFEKENDWVQDDQLIETLYTINFKKSEVL